MHRSLPSKMPVTTRSPFTGALRRLSVFALIAGIVLSSGGVRAANSSIRQAAAAQAPFSEADIQPENQPSTTAGFELESAPLSPALTENAEPSEQADLRLKIDELRTEIDALQTEIKRKQDVPDTRKKFSARVGGMLEIETVAIDQSDANQAIYGDIDNDYGFRDVRVWVKGEGYENLSYNVTLGFTGRLTFKNVMLTAEDLPVLGKASIGHFDVEMGMGYLESTYDYTLVEEDTINTAFSFGRRLGVGSVHYGADQNIRLFTGVYTGKPLSIGDGKSANENSDNVGILLNTRLTAVPVYRETSDGALEEVLHLGGAFCWVDPGKDSRTGLRRPTTLQAQPTCWLSDMPALFHGEIVTDHYSITGIETAWQRRRFGLIGEGFIGNYKGYDNAYGVAATGRFLLTPGAYQKYDKSGGYFAGINIPENMRFVDHENHTCLEGWGAWELIGQWSWIDMDTLRGAPAADFYGRMHQYTVAVNWYWNPQVRWGINWIYAKPISGFAGNDETASSLNTLACQARFTF